MAARPGLIEPLIVGIELRQHNDQDGHSADCAMADAWRNDDALMFANGDHVSIQFHFCIGFALQKDVCFRQRLVVVQLCIFADLRDVQSPGKLIDPMQSASRSAARARDRINQRKIRELPAWGA